MKTYKIRTNTVLTLRRGAEKLKIRLRDSDYSLPLVDGFENWANSGLPLIDSFENWANSGLPLIEGFEKWQS